MKTLKPVSAVVMTSDGICGCQCASLLDVDPQCMKSICGGIFASPSPAPAAAEPLEHLESTNRCYVCHACHVSTTPATCPRGRRRGARAP